MSKHQHANNVAIPSTKTIWPLELPFECGCSRCQYYRVGLKQIERAGKICAGDDWRDTLTPEELLTRLKAKVTKCPAITLLADVVGANMQSQIIMSENDSRLNHCAAVNTQDASEASCCVICQDVKPNVAVIWCGHVILCKGCAKKYKQRGVDTCPVCRGEITSLLHLYY